MNVFELFATLTLKTDEYDKKLDESIKRASDKTGIASADISKSVQGIQKGMLDMSLSGISAIGEFGKSAIQVGMEFDSSMSQVVATMGYTVDELNNAESEASQNYQKLRDFAKEMGSTTAFSASQAAEALNYMALAGYKTDDAISMLPNVLSLAAAGGIDLASASDMVTDAQSALGLSMDETVELVDKMAKASSNSNTSVAQLGEAILTVGGTAQTLAGGTTELSTALGILADSGVKGAEGGTALRNVLLALSPTTKDAIETFNRLDIAAYDSSGNMRPLADTFQDLSERLRYMSDKERQDTLSNIFNKVDLKSVNALLGAAGDEIAAISVALGNAAEEAAESGKGTIAWSEYAEEYGIEATKLYEDVAASLKNMADGGIEAQEQIEILQEEFGFTAEEAQQAFTIANIALDENKNRWEGLTETIEDSVGAAEAMAGVQLDNAEGGITTLKSAWEGFQIAVSEDLMPTVKNLIGLLTDVVKNMDTIVPIVLGAATAFGVFSVAINLTSIIKSVTTAMTALNVVLAANPIGLVVAAIAGLAVALVTLWNKNEGFRNALINAWNTIRETASNVFRTVAKAVATFRDSIVNAWNVIREKTSQIFASVANFILTAFDVIRQLPARAKEWGMNILTGLWNGISDKIAWLKSRVSGVVDKIKSWFVGKEGFDEHSPSKWAAQVGAFVSEGLAQGIESKKDEAQKKAEELAKNVYSSLKSWADKQVKYQELSLQEQIELWEEIQRQYAAGTEQYADAEDKLFDLRKQRAKEQEQIVKDTYSAVKSWIDKETKYRELSTETQIHMWEQVQGQFAAGSEQWNDAEDKLFDLRKQRLKEQEQAEQDFSKKIEDVYKNIEDLEKNYAKELESRVQQIFNTYKLFDAVPERQEVSGRELINNLQGQIANIEEFCAKVQELSDRGVGEGLVESIRAMGPSAIDELSALLSLTEEELGEYAGLFAEKQELANSLAVEQLQGLREKTDQQIQENMDSLSGIMQSVVDESASWGSDLISNFIGGIKEMESELTYAVAGAAQLVRDYLGFSEPKKGPLSNFHTYAPDMMQLFADGIKDSESIVSNQINKSFDFDTRTVDFASSSLGRSSVGGTSGYAMPELPQIVLEISGDIGQIVRLLHPRLRWEDKRVGRSLVNV